MKNLLAVNLFLITTLFLAACVTVDPKLVAANMKVIAPQGAGPFPVIIYFQGTGGHNRRQETWARWFKRHGVASAIVDNAWIRRRTQNPTGSRYTEDAAIAWDLLKNDARIDGGRFAIMGFSRGGGMSLMSGSHFGAERAIPDFVFALYPGGFGQNWCSHSHDDRTRIFIFFGDEDDIGPADGLFEACRDLANREDNVTYHELKGATHGYDDTMGQFFWCCRPPLKVRVSPNPEAVAITRDIILKAIKDRWKLSDPPES